MVKYANHKLSESGIYYVPNDGEGKADYIEFIKTELPLNDIPEIFGMHDNAEITSAINNTNAMLGTALSLQPRSTGGDGKSADSVLQELAQSILDKLPANFDIEKAAKLHPIDYLQSMNTVL